MVVMVAALRPYSRFKSRRRGGGAGGRGGRAGWLCVGMVSEYQRRGDGFLGEGEPPAWSTRSTAIWTRVYIVFLLVFVLLNHFVFVFVLAAARCCRLAFLGPWVLPPPCILLLFVLQTACLSVWEAEGERGGGGDRGPSAVENTGVFIVVARQGGR